MLYVIRRYWRVGFLLFFISSIKGSINIAERIVPRSSSSGCSVFIGRFLLFLLLFTDVAYSHPFSVNTHFLHLLLRIWFFPLFCFHGLRAWCCEAPADPTELLRYFIRGGFFFFSPTWNSFYGRHMQLRVFIPVLWILNCLKRWLIPWMLGESRAFMHSDLGLYLVYP